MPDFTVICIKVVAEIPETRYAPNPVLAVSSQTLPVDDRPLDQITFAGDLGDEERDLVLRRAKVEAEIAGFPQEAKGEAGARVAELKGALRSIEERILPLKAEREAVAASVRQLLGAAEITTAQAIIEHGCTGLFGKLNSIEAVREVRDNMGGSQIGLPCYIGNDRYCLIHQTIGGLQENQEPKFAKYATAISRELTDAERGYRKVVENARRKQGPNRMADAREMLQADEEARRKRHKNGGVTDQETTLPSSPPDLADHFKCAEHGELFLGCRFCVAQAIVEGPLEPKFFVHHGEATSIMLDDWRDGTAAQEKLDQLTDSGVNKAAVYALVASFRRKLARD